MSSKTKIVVLHMKEVVYTGIFVALAIVLAVLLFMMFGRDKAADPANAQAVYHAGVYTSPITLNDNTFDVEVTVDEDHINSISLKNLSETTTAMYPLMEPCLESIADQVCETQSLEGITWPEENQYTSQLLLEAISAALQKAAVAESETQAIP